MALPNLGTSPRAVDMGTTQQREIRSNERDFLLDGSVHGAVDISVAAGGTINPTDEERLENGFLRFTGSPPTDPVLDIPETARQLEFLNDSSRDIATTAADGELLLEAADSLLLEDGSGVLLLEASSVFIPAGESKVVMKEGDVFFTLGTVGQQTGALEHGGGVVPTAAINFADFELARGEFKDYGRTANAVASSSGTLTLDISTGNAFTTTLTEAVTTLTLSNPSPSGAMCTVFLIATQDAGAGHVITWPGTFIWERASGESPAQTTTTLAVDIYMFQTPDAGTTWYGFVLGLDMG